MQLLLDFFEKFCELFRVVEQLGFAPLPAFPALSLGIPACFIAYASATFANFT